MRAAAGPLEDFCSFTNHTSSQDAMLSDLGLLHISTLKICARTVH